MEMLFHVGHVLEGVIFFDAPPLILVPEEMFKELVPHLILLHLLEGGEIVLVICLEDMIEVLLPSLAPILGDILYRVLRWGPHTTATLGWGAFRC